jgi:hypothetical protein
VSRLKNMNRLFLPYFTGFPVHFIYLLSGKTTGGPVRIISEIDAAAAFYLARIRFSCFPDAVTGNRVSNFFHPGNKASTFYSQI